MARRRPDNQLKAAMWRNLVKAAKKHHKHPQDHGIMALIADDAGVSRPSVSDWKRGSTYPEEATLRRLATLYRVSVDWLSGETDANQSYESPDDLLNRAADITELVCRVLLKNGTVDDFTQVMRRAHALLLQGMNDNEVRGQLLDEFSDWHPTSTDGAPRDNDD